MDYSNASSLWEGREFAILPYSDGIAWYHVRPVPGIYLFCEIDGTPLTWIPHYIGESDNLRHRLRYHNRWNEAAGQGATHVHVLAIYDPFIRHAFEERLIYRFRPILNSHHNRSRSERVRGRGPPAALEQFLETLNPNDSFASQEDCAKDDELFAPRPV